MKIRVAKIADLGAEVKLFDDEKARLESFGSAKRRREFLAGRALLRSISSEHFPVGGDGESLRSAGGLYASISHGGEYVACAVAAYPVGIDIEEMKARRDYAGALKKAGVVARADISREEFYKLWTQFEAGYKFAHVSSAKPFLQSREWRGYMISLASANKEKLEIEK
ncbi:MAG: hypothetical protein FWD15_03060 [Alphaproteobacteria bacterium]|nr:hypothetical protein [Alphaproteobacteria bacterium]